MAVRLRLGGRFSAWYAGPIDGSKPAEITIRVSEATVFEDVELANRVRHLLIAATRQKITLEAA